MEGQKVNNCGKCHNSCSCLIADGLICHNCKFKGQKKDTFITICQKHKNDYLEPNCHPKSLNTPFDAVAIDFSTMNVFCEKHFIMPEAQDENQTITQTFTYKRVDRSLEENLHILKNEYTVDILKKAIDKKEIHSKKLRNELNAQQIFNILKKHHLKNTNEFLCFKHMKIATRINKETFVVKCEICEFENNKTLCFRHKEEVLKINRETPVAKFKMCDSEINDILCTENMEETKRINTETSVVKCKKCDPDINDMDLNEETAEELYRVGVGKCMEFNTASFSKNLLLLLRNNGIKDKKFYSFFFYCFADNLANRTKWGLTSRSKCLICFRRFKLGTRVAVMVHNVLKHEICLECYEKHNKQNNAHCPIDNEPFSLPYKVYIIESFFKTDLPCCAKCLKKNPGKTDLYGFSFYNSNYPYLLPCNNNQCQDCFDDIDCSIECTCKNNSYHNKDLLNHDYIENLESLEMICPQHNLTIKWCSTTYRKGYCNNCSKPEQFLLQTNLKQISDGIQIPPDIIRKLNFANTLWIFREICIYFITDKMFNLLRISKNAIYEQIQHFPLNDLYSSCNEIITKRFNTIFPQNPLSSNYWIINSSNYYETFKIILPKKNKYTRYMLAGLVVGRCKTLGRILVQRKINEVYKIICQCDIETADICNGVTTQNIYFSDVIFSEEVNIYVCFTQKGMYCHGYLSLKETENFTKMLPTSLGVKMISETNLLGNQTYGGPVIGAIVLVVPNLKELDIREIA